jgi:hypothetical protein
VLLKCKLSSTTNTITKVGSFHCERRCQRGSKEISLKEKSHCSEEKSFTSEEKEIGSAHTFACFLIEKAGERLFPCFFLNALPL